MKKSVLLSLAVMLTCGIITASETPMTTDQSVSVTPSSSQVSFPTGVFFNGSNFVKVESTWVRICVGGESIEPDIRNAEEDPWGNYALVLSNGESITINSNGRSLYYNGATYYKK